MATPGEVRLVWFPFSHSEPEPYKKRPVLILAVHGSPPDQAILVAMVTGNPARFARPTSGDIPLVDWVQFGLAKPSVIRTRRIWTAEGRDLVQEPALGTVTPNVLKTVKDELRRLLD